MHVLLHMARSGGQQRQLPLLLRQQHSTITVQQASGVGWGEAAARVAWRRLQVSILRIGLPKLTSDDMFHSWCLSFPITCDVCGNAVVVVHPCRSWNS